MARPVFFSDAASPVGIPTPDVSIGTSGCYTLDMQACVYIIQDAIGRFYVGSTRNIERRIKQHQGKVSRFTKRLQFPKVVLIQEFESISTARKVERRIKKLKRKDYIQRMVDDGFIKLHL